MKHLTDEQLDAAILSARVPHEAAQLDAYARALVRDIERHPLPDEVSTEPVRVGDRVLEQRDMDSRHTLLRAMVDSLKQRVSRSRS